MRLLGDSVQIKMPTKAKVRRLTKFVFLNLRDLQSPKYAGFAAGLYSWTFFQENARQKQSKSSVRKELYGDERPKNVGASRKLTKNIKANQGGGGGKKKMAKFEVITKHHYKIIL